jgi:hypothetical protein
MIWRYPAGCFVLSLLAATASAQSTFVRVADTSTAVPNAGAATFSAFTGAPAVSGSSVLFNGRFADPSFINGLYTGTTAGGPLGTIAVELQTTAPNTGGGTFNYLKYTSAQSISGATVVFAGQYNGGTGGAGHGLYAGPAAGGAPSRVADSSQIMPGALSAFGNFTAATVSGSTVAFSADNGVASGANRVVGVFTSTTAGGAPVRIVDSSATMPGQGFVFDKAFAGPSVSGSVVAFAGTHNATSYAAVYTANADGTGLAAVADTNTLIPGGSTAFRQFGNPAVSGPTVAFEGRNISSDGVYTAPVGGGSLARVADRSTAIPGGSGTFQDFGDPAISGSVLAFTGTGSGAQKGLYAIDTNGGALSKVIAVGDTLDGRTVSDVIFGGQGLDGTTLVFEADFTDSTSGVYAVPFAPVPEPACVLLVGATGLAGLAWGRKRLAAR